MIYLDYAATTPMSEEALNAYQQAARRFFGNSQSLHDVGSEAERALEGSRKLIAGSLNAEPRGLFFTGSGSEASFLALVSLVHANRSGGNHIITTQVEHSSVRNAFTWLEGHGFRVTRLPVRESGQIDPEELLQALSDQTILVSIQHVNSETGIIQSLEEIGAVLSSHQALFHSDMIQSFGKLPLDINKWGVQSLSVSAHKIHGPKGIGACYISPTISWSPFIPGTTHEHGFRPGTLDIPSAVAFATAVKETSANREGNFEHVNRLKTTLIENLTARCGQAITVEGNPQLGSPYILGLRVYGMEGQFAMLECNQKGLGISTGSACRINEQKPSATLLAMGRSKEEAGNFVRLSFDPQTTESEIEESARILQAVIEKHLQVIK